MNILVVSKEKEKNFFENSFSTDYDVNYVTDAKQALSFIENNRSVDVLVLDMNLSGDSALDLISQIRSTDYGEDLFILIITNQENTDLEIEGLKRGADDYIRRPLEKDSFEAVFKLYERFFFQRSEKNKFKELAMIYDALFQQAPVGIAISHSEKPLEGRRNEFFEVNKRYMEITGRNKEELIATGWSSITHPEDREKELPLYRNMQNGLIDSYEMEKRFIKPDGSIVWVYLVGRALDLNIYTENSHICIIQDITERKEAEMALGESERSMGVLISNMPGLVYRCKNDKNWTMEFLSEKSEEILGYKPEELIDNKEISFNDIILPEYKNELETAWKESLKKRKRVELIYEIKTKSGETKWIFEIGEGDQL